MSADGGEEAADTRRGLLRWAVRETMGVVMVAVTLFLPAGRLNWLMGWALVALYAVWIIALAALLIPTNPQLLIERASRRQGGKTWDVALLSLGGLAVIATHLAAGFDLRFDWPGRIAPGLQIAALVVAALGYALTTWAMTANAFFSLVVRIQDDRGHAVASGGPYRYVRHPGYVGTILFQLATPVLLGSLWALIPGGISALLTVARTALEDRDLHEELPGYQQYAGQVRHRLLPGVW